MYTHKTSGRYKGVVDYVTVVTKTMESVNDMITMGNMNTFNNGRYKYIVDAKQTELKAKHIIINQSKCGSE